MKLTASRVAALNVLRAIRSGELADRAFARSVGTLAPREGPWLHELVFGTLRLRGRLDFILERFVKRGIASLDADVLDILRLGSYQLLEMNSVPAYAAVSQSVELAKSVAQRGASGLVNGVLQSVRRSQRELVPPATLDSVAALTQWGSHPRWLVERWIERFGMAATVKLIAANNTRPDLYVRAVGQTPAEVIAAASAAGITLEPVAVAPDALRVVDGSVPELLENLPVIVQDPAAGLVVRYADVAGGVVADVCAAPGGKAIALADSVGDRGMVVASDLSASRLRRAFANTERLSTQSPSLRVSQSLKFLVADARQPALDSADVVLLDAPCTGTATLRRHPDGKWRITSEDLDSLAQVQRELLAAAGSIVRVGGILVYATCSLEPEENQQQVNAFLDRHPNFVRRPPSKWHANDLIDRAGDLVVLPQDTGFDGSFAARLERVA